MELWTFNDLKSIVKLPVFQRDMDIAHMNEIYTSLRDEMQRGINPCLPGCLIVAELSIGPASKEYMLIDGNHRLAAIGKLDDTDMRVFVNFIVCQSREEAEELFRKVNKSLPMPVLPDSVRLTDVKPIVRYFTDMYPKIFKNGVSGTCQRPHLHGRVFSEQVAKLLEAGLECDYIITGLLEFNRRLSLRHPKSFKTSSRDTEKRMQELLDSCMEKGGCYLGMVCVNGDYSVMFEYFSLFDVEPKLKRVVNFTKPQRAAIWDRHFPGQRYGRCHNCQKQIEITDFHCAHDVAFSRLLRESREGTGDGLKEDIDNIYPCCAGCNLSMGTTELSKMCVTAVE